MFNRKKLDRERLEIYFVYLLLAYRRLILICGSILLVSGAAVVISSLAAGGILVAVGAFLALLACSYHAVLFTSRLAARIGTLFQRNL
jgi:hypothetical protein